MLFRSPVGDITRWYVSNPYANYYQLVPKVFAYHTGIDLLLQEGSSARQPLYAITDGLVTFARRVTGSTWGNVLVIQHTDAGGKHFYSRYGHDDEFEVSEGQRVCVGQFVARVGNAFGQFVYHLHFDVSLTETLLTHPADWPGLDLERLRRDYVDPRSFLKGQRMATNNELIRGFAEQIISLATDPIPPPPVPPPPPAPDPAAQHAVVKTTGGDRLNVRAAPVNGKIIGQLPNGDSEMVLDSGTAGWWKLSGGAYDGGYASAQYLVLVNPQ